jgi:hypothetical protein
MDTIHGKNSGFWWRFGQGTSGDGAIGPPENATAMCRRVESAVSPSQFTSHLFNSNYAYHANTYFNGTGGSSFGIGLRGELGSPHALLCNT